MALLLADFNGLLTIAQYIVSLRYFSKLVTIGGELIWVLDWVELKSKSAIAKW